MIRNAPELGTVWTQTGRAPTGSAHSPAPAAASWRGSASTFGPMGRGGRPADVFVRFGVACGIVHVPAKGCGEWVKKLPAKLGFVVLASLVSIELLFETSDEVQDSLWGAHAG